jgi:hypothetical protein
MIMFAFTICREMKKTRREIHVLVIDSMLPL